jgi:D-xylose 1-dehydrogenase (NADP+, D-xylono-1,5-lactone-forming)
MIRKLRWGIVSTARINRRIIPAIERSEGSEVVAIGSRDLRKAQDYAAKWNIPRSYGSYEALLDDPDLDAVYIPLPNHLHCTWTVKAAQAGKHVLCEKPLALSVSEVDIMLAAARRNGVVLVEAFQFRFHPQTRIVRDLIRSGDLGTIQLVRAWFTFSVSDPANIRLQPQTGGGSLWDGGCYPICFMQGVLAEEPVEVFAWQRTGPTGVDVVFAGQLRYQSGMLAQFDSGFQAPYRVGVEVVGSEAVLYSQEAWRAGIDGHRGQIRIDRHGEETKIAVPDVDPFLGQIQAVEACIRDGTHSAMPVADSRSNVATIAALYKSAATGRPVGLDGELGQGRK